MAVGLDVNVAAVDSLPLGDVVAVAGDCVGGTVDTSPTRAISVGLDEGASDDDGTVKNGALVVLCEDVGIIEGDAVGTSEVISPPRKSPVGPGDGKSVLVGDCVKKGTPGDS